MVTDSYRLVTPGTRVIHVSIDPDVIGMNFPTELGLVADARTFEAVLDATSGWKCCPPRPSSSTLPTSRPSAPRGTSGGWAGGPDGLDGRAMRPEAIMAALDRRLADDAVLVADTGYSSAWAGALSEIKEAGRHFMRADGSLGWASRRRWAPSSRSPIGRSCASPVTAASAITSVTSRRPSATSPVIVVILNNQTLAFEEHVQGMLYNKVVPR